MSHIYLADLRRMQSSLRLLWNCDMTIKYKVRTKVQNKCFRLALNSSLRLAIFQVTNVIHNLHFACYLIPGSLAIFNSTFFKKLKAIYILKLKERFKRKEFYDKGILAPYENKSCCLQWKWYELKMKV